MDTILKFISRKKILIIVIDIVDNIEQTEESCNTELNKKFQLYKSGLRRIVTAVISLENVIVNIIKFQRELKPLITK